MNWEEIRKEYEASPITMKELAEKHGAKLGTLKSRASREKWLSNHDKKVATKKATERKKVATKIKNVATHKAIEDLEGNTELNDKQKLFCLYFSQFNNATKAYQKVYECEYGTAKTNGNLLLTNTDIRTEIKRIKKARSDDWLITDADIAEEWIRMAFPDVNDYLEYEGDDVSLKPADEVDGRIIQEIKISKFGTTVKLYDKQKALIELRKILLNTDELNNEFTKKRIQKLEEEIKLIKGKEPDTSLMKLLLNTVGEDDEN